MSFLQFLKFVKNLLKGVVSILLLVGVALDNVALSKFPSKIFMRFYNMNSGGSLRARHWAN